MVFDSDDEAIEEDEEDEEDEEEEEEEEDARPKDGAAAGAAWTARCVLVCA